MYISLSLFLSRFGFVFGFRAFRVSVVNHGFEAEGWSGISECKLP